MSSAVIRVLDQLKQAGHLQGKDIANIASVSPATVTRWQQGKAAPTLQTQTRLAELRFVVDRLNDFYTPEEARLWLHTPHALLKGKRAIDLIMNGQTEDVLAALEALDSAAYV
jgi:putative toxin-antitoxin system antitoxin component (TIGR02293 family)